MKPEDVTGWAPEVKHGTMQEQPANQRGEISLSWKQKSYTMTSSTPSGIQFKFFHSEFALPEENFSLFHAVFWWNLFFENSRRYDYQRRPTEDQSLESTQTFQMCVSKS